MIDHFQTVFEQMSLFSLVRMRRVGKTMGRIHSKRCMWQMLGDTLKGRYKMSFLTLCICILLVAYVVFPFDIIPDYIPILGWLDDGLVVYLIVMRLNNETQRYMRYKAMGRKTEQHY